MGLTDDLLRLADAYCAAQKIVRPTLSGMIMRDSRVLDRVAGGGSLTVRSYERCMDWLVDHWPSGLDWPEGIARPARSKDSVESAKAAA